MRDMNKHIVKTDDNQPFHTSGYAQVATGNRLGAASTVSFGRRQQIEESRTRVAAYRQSAIGRNFGVSQRAKAVDDASGRPAAIPSEGLGSAPAASLPPKSGPYNPFA
jgi:hypothetical protein